MVGRELQRSYGQEPQVVITVPILEGLDGKNKMSKSLDNYVGIDEAPNEMFGKIMSISDELMWRWFDLLSFKTTDEINVLKADQAKGKNPRDIKNSIYSLPEIVKKRMSKAKSEISHWIEYDYVIINDKLDNCFKEISVLIDSEINKTKASLINIFFNITKKI